MVIGNGLMSSAFFEKFAVNDAVLIFGSGVAHSKAVRTDEFERERELLLHHLHRHSRKLLVYFSTCSVYDPTENRSPYVLHKLAMEELVARSEHFLICRVSNVVGGTRNNSTIFNFLAHHIKNEIPFVLWKKAARNIIDVDDVASIVNFLLDRTGDQARIVNVANTRSYGVDELVCKMEVHFGKKAIYSTSDSGSFYEIDTGHMREICSATGIGFPLDYIEKLLDKYFRILP
jgi:UDP-2-acetamido-2,6-beta-L-arabino-hexul-4-ose reductase